MTVFDRYVLKNLSQATLFIALTLAAIVFLTQSLQFLELVIESSASSAAFWMLTLLALPRFFEIILPIALMAAVLFIYNRMTADSEMVAIRVAGYSPFALAKPAIRLALVVTLVLWVVTMWISPRSLAEMQHMRQVIKAQFSALLFREGVFNQAGKGLTVYMRERSSEGEMRGLMIYDSRDKASDPSTVLAKRGVIVATPEGEQVLVYDGSRQQYDPDKGVLHRLNFERYTIDLPDSNPVTKRWREPEERTTFELLFPDKESVQDPKMRYEFLVEIHRRIAAPLMAMALALVSCAALLLGPVERRGQTRKIVFAIGLAVVLQSAFLSVYNLSRKFVFAIPLMYLLLLLPALAALFLLSPAGEGFRRKLFARREEGTS